MSLIIFIFSMAVAFLFVGLFASKKLDEYVGKMLGAVVTRDSSGVWLEWPHLGFMSRIGIMGRLKMPVDDTVLTQFVSNMTTEEEVLFMTQSPAVAKTYAESEGRDATILLILQTRKAVLAEQAKALSTGVYMESYDHHLRQIDLTLKSLF